MTDPDAPDVELLADLDAGLLDPARAREVRRAALADPRSAAVLHALTATQADLAAVPAPEAPPELVAGWMAALGTPPAPADAPATRDASLTVAGAARPPGHRARPGARGRRPTILRRRWVLLAAALVVGVLALRPAGPPDLTRVELAGFARSTVGSTDLGALADPARRDGCLTAAGHQGAAVLGGRQVRLDGTPGVLLVLSTGELGRFRVLVVTPACAVLADDVVGR